LRLGALRVGRGRPGDRECSIDYTIDNALFQWEDGERRVRERDDLDAPTLAVVEELRRRLGSAFTLAELAALYAEDKDWAAEAAAGGVAGTETAGVVDAAFGRYAREASDYARALRP
jgi:hypothetical protein